MSPRWRTDAVPPATPTAFCSPGLWQGAGVRPLSRSARPSRCNHALITALGKFTVWSRHRLCLTLTKLLITAGGGRGARARRQGGASGRGAKSGGVHVPPKIPSVGWPSAVSAPCLCCGGLGEDAEAGGGSWGGLRGGVCVPPGLLNTECPQTRSLGSRSQRAGEGRWGGKAGAGKGFPNPRLPRFPAAANPTGLQDGCLSPPWPPAQGGGCTRRPAAIPEHAHSSQKDKLLPPQGAALCCGCANLRAMRGHRPRVGGIYGT